MVQAEMETLMKYEDRFVTKDYLHAQISDVKVFVFTVIAPIYLFLIAQLAVIVWFLLNKLPNTG